MAELWEKREKDIAPLNNPPQSKERRLLHCDYCSYTTKFQGALDRHSSRYHELEVAAQGNRVVGEEGDKYERQRQCLIAKGWIDCQWLPGNACPGLDSLLARRFCQHRAECLGRAESCSAMTVSR